MHKPRRRTGHYAAARRLIPAVAAIVVVITLFALTGGSLLLFGPPGGSGRGPLGVALVAQPPLTQTPPVQMRVFDPVAPTAALPEPARGLEGVGTSDTSSAAAAAVEDAEARAARARSWEARFGNGTGRAAAAGMRAPHAAPAWCAELAHAPRAQHLHGSRCTRASPDMDLCADGGHAFFGQFSHDLYLWAHHFRHLARRGVYLDLAANHAKIISNTYFLDTCAGWDGLCVEANKMYFPELRRFRTCQLLEGCVSDRVENVTFMNYLGLSGIADTNKNMPEFNASIYNATSVNMTCTVLGVELRERQTLDIDYMSLDLEGHELTVLQSIDWNATTIRVISLEVAEKGLPVEAFLLEKGYVQHVPTVCDPTDTSLDSLCMNGDKVYLHSDVTFGSPE